MGQHLKTIEQPFIIEIIDERFDNISTMLTDNAVVYGSSITSIISGLPANGDLDIAVSHIEFMTLCKRFANSSKWKQTAGNTIRETDFNNKKSFRGVLPRSRAADPITFRPLEKWTSEPPTSRWSDKLRGTSKKQSSTKPGYRNISKTVTFETVGNKCVQIIQAKEETNDPLADALSIVLAVDFVFCGIAIDKHGKIFEVIKSALDDCKSKIIRVANYHSKLTERFNKYTKRGWSLGISIDQANQNYLNQKKDKKEKQLYNNKYATVSNNKYEHITLQFNPIILKKLMKEELRNLVTSIAKKMFDIHLREVGVAGNSLTYIEDVKAKGYNITEKIAHQICDAVIYRFKNRFPVKKKKKFRTYGDYREVIVNPFSDEKTANHASQFSELQYVPLSPKASQTVHKTMPYKYYGKWTTKVEATADGGTVGKKLEDLINGGSNE